MQQQREEEQEETGQMLRASPSSQVETTLGVAAAELLHGLVIREDDGGAGHEDDHDDEDERASEEDFEFAVPGSAFFDGLEAVTADEIFSNGMIRPLYPLFGRALEPPLNGRSHGDAGEVASVGKEEMRAGLPLRHRELMLEHRDPPSAVSSSSESDGLEGVPAGSYCVWDRAQSADLRRKSLSAGANSKRWRLGSVGRSRSDGKERLVFVDGAGTRSKKKAEEPPEAAKGGKGRGKGVTVIDVETAHRPHYARGGPARGDRRRSFLPYRKDLLGGF